MTSENPCPLVLGVALLVVSALGLLLAHDLASRPLATLILLAVGVAGLWIVAPRLETRNLSLGAVLIPAAALRLLALPLAPTLSDDVLRYVWDGRVAAAGLNPYVLPPDAPELLRLRNPLWHQMPHRQVATVYPPLSVALFSIAARFSRPIPLWKAMITGIDLLLCGALCGLAKHLGVAAGRTVWYAWNPLVWVEVAGMGHVDALGVAAVVGAVWAVCAGRRWLWAATCAASAGALAKLAPVAAWPMWARQSLLPGRFWGAAVALTGISLAPVILTSGAVPRGLRTYALSWEFNGPLYEPLWRLLNLVGASGGIRVLLDWSKRLTGQHELLNRLYPYVYPQLLAKVLLAAVAVGLIVRSLGFAHPVTGSGRLFASLLLCSATLYPWYLLWMLPWAALCRQRAWLLLSGTIFLSYLPQLYSVPLVPGIFLLEWAPFLFVWGRHRRWSID